MDRLDKYISEKYNITRNKAQNLIRNGFVFVNNLKIVKVSYLVKENDTIIVSQEKMYVSRGAYKLLGAIESFGLNFENRVVLDVGASTGGFTQVALENGAKKVYAVDVGKGELDKSLSINKQVINLENTDIRTLEKSQIMDINLIVGDLSFISLTKVLPYIKDLLGNQIEMIFLFKPQFECGKDIAKKYKGIIKSREIHERLLENFIDFTKLINISISDIAYSPIKGGDGNIEYLIHFNKDVKYFNVKSIVNSAFDNLKNNNCNR